MITSALNSALQGLAYHQKAFADHAQRIASWQPAEPPADPDRVDLPREMVGLLMAKRGYQANLAVVKAADEMLGTLIDILA